jgi:NtrC-family two-component system response regulator AlgB
MFSVGVVKGGFAVLRALVVDDDPSLSEALRRSLRAWGFGAVEIARSGDAAMDLLARDRYDVLLLDLRFEGDWHEVLAAARASVPPTAVFMMSGGGDIKTAVEALHLGAADFLEKPIDPEALRARLEPLIDARSTPAIESEAMREALALADRVASTPASSALIVGESGVGKEVLAARIHEKSSRREGPFVRVNLAAIHANVVEAELFGNTRGAFTDAKRDRLGYLASADGGTILLDEIGEFRTDLQAKLLRAIEERRFYPIGSDRERSINVRILAATNRDPEELVSANVLRADLFYRLGTVIRIPPLRERVDEIVPLASHFIDHFCREFGRPQYHLGPEATAELRRYAWPGNIRELRNVIERAVMMSEDETIGPGLIAPIAKSEPSVAALGLRQARARNLDEAEREHIIRVLRLAGDSKSAAAHMLGVSRSTLYEKMKRYGIAR